MFKPMSSGDPAKKRVALNERPSFIPGQYNTFGVATHADFAHVLPSCIVIGKRLEKCGPASGTA